ncbi:hypothetical protein PHJA_002162800, partial [Phtheirospermum japonicum]
KGSSSTKFPIQKQNILELVKLFRFKVYHPGINCPYDSLLERNQKRVCCCHFERIKKYRSNV